MTVQEKIQKQGYQLPPPSSPVGNYLPLMESRGLVYISGQLAKRDGELVHPGKIGTSGAVSIEQARSAAVAAALCALSVFYARFADFDLIEQILQLKGYVNTTPDFTQHPKVIDGASNLLVAVFGNKGRHSRVALGVASLPSNSSVEIELILRITT